MHDPDTQQQSDTARLADAVETLSNLRVVRIPESTFALMWFQFLRGLAFGLGTVIGGTAMVSVLVLLLSQVEFVPIIGDFATRIIEEIRRP